MKFRLGTIVGPSFVEAYNRLLDAKLEAKTSYWLAKALRQFDQESKAFMKARASVMEKHGITAETRICPENKDKFESADKELAPLLDQEVEIDVKPVVLPLDFQITARDLFALEGLVTVTELDEKPAP